MTDLASWLLEQIAADEQVAREAAAGSSGVRQPSWGPEWTLEEDDDPGYSGTWGIHSDAGTVISAGEVMRPEGRHIARWDPARVLAEIAAKRRLITRHSHTYTGDDGYQWCPRDDDHVPCLDLRTLAAPYADRPGYNSEWAL